MIYRILVSKSNLDVRQFLAEHKSNHKQKGFAVMPKRKQAAQTAQPAANNKKQKTVTPASNADANNTLVPFTSSVATIKATLDAVTPKVNAVASTIGNVAYNVANVASYLKPFIIKSKIEPLVLTYKEKKPRKVSLYKSNKSASLAMPSDTAELTKCSDKKPEPISYLTTMVHSIIGFFRSGHPPTLQDTKPTLPPVSFGLAEHAIKVLKQKFTTTKDPKTIDALHLESVELFKDHIKEHGARRVDAFLYLLVAVHRKQVLITKESTEKQHGKGSIDLDLQACHSALFPNLKFKKIPGLFSNVKQDDLLAYKETNLEDLLNTTVLLPHIVNVFDGYLEGKAKQSQLVQHCLLILNKVSRNELDPRAGMSEFLKAMNDYFDFFETNYIKTGKVDNPETMKKILEYEKAGTMLAANADFSVKSEYIYSMLRLKPTEITKVKYFQLLLPYYENIQNELLSLSDRYVKKQKLSK